MLTIGSLMIDRERDTVTVDGAVQPLKPREFALLETLGRRLGFVLTRDRLLDIAWPEDKAVVDAASNEHFARLRRTLGDAVNIRTVSGTGYALDPPRG